MPLNWRPVEDEDVTPSPLQEFDFPPAEAAVGPRSSLGCPERFRLHRGCVSHFTVDKRCDVILTDAISSCGTVAPRTSVFIDLRGCFNTIASHFCLQCMSR